MGCIMPCVVPFSMMPVPAMMPIKPPWKSRARRTRLSDGRTPFDLNLNFLVVKDKTHAFSYLHCSKLTVRTCENMIHNLD